MSYRIAPEVAQTISNQALAAAPYEACGLLAGRGRYIEQALALPNRAEQPKSEYDTLPRDLLPALQQIDALGLDWLGSYHSHPQSPPIPSPRDIRSSSDPKLLQLIVSLAGQQPALKLWRIKGAEVCALDLEYSTVPLEATLPPLQAGQRQAVITAAVASLLLLLLLALWLLPPAPSLASA